MIAETTMQRLALIRYLYTGAIEESKQPEPFGQISILKFHDSVELFLDVACDQFGIPAKKTKEFKDYWSALEEHLQGQSLSQKRAMDRLNSARVEFKHHGNMLSTSDIEKFRVNVTDFFEENTSLIFGIEFSKISMTYLIQNTRVRTLLDEANALIEEGKRGDALTKNAIAFAQLIDDYTQNEKARRYRELFFTRDPFPLHIGSSTGNQGPQFEQFVRSVTASIDTLRQGMQVLSLGIDYPRYVKFRLLTPPVVKMQGATDYQPPVPMQYTQDTLPSVETCGFCQDFVVASAIRLQKFSFEASM